MTITDLDDDVVVPEVRSSAAGRIGILTLNRGPQRNPLDFATVAALNARLDEFLDDPSMRAVVLTGSPPAFSAGGDLKAYLDLYRDKVRFRAFLEAIAQLCDKFESSRLLSVAAINGACVAGGLEVALSCDVIVAGRSARIGDGHLKFWQLPGGGGSQRLPRAVGLPMAKKLFYTHALLTAEEALGVGLVTDVFEDDELLERTVALVKNAITTPEETVRAMKGLLAVANREPLPVGLGAEIDTVVDYASNVEGAAYRGLHEFLGRTRPEPDRDGSDERR
ncbi:enoyl-CoA hydratase/isomerase family protein [Pseudonocardia pini]|uniref:enoyl-CoA hydratase/isomerase family protein n=1 Tax=Pseudonocardia pini TaxID=2758030 RepID=UPI0015F0B8B8|nr:enoyl-CoA hydratase/isomerase family protein [Pseudonocardia pini]